TMLEGWARSAQGQSDGIAQFNEGLAAYNAISGIALLSYCYTLRADAHWKLGHPKEAVEALNDAFTFAEKYGEQFWLPEMYRLKGDLLIAQRATEDKVEEAYRQAAMVARNHNAKSLELRAVTSLARLWQKQGKAPEAHDSLRTIFEWFTEGFETA